MLVADAATGRITAANDAAVRQYGFRRDELVGLPFDRLVAPGHDHDADGSGAVEGDEGTARGALARVVPDHKL
jgi:PAS domain-containing protein